MHETDLYTQAYAKNVVQDLQVEAKTCIGAF